MGEGLWSPGTSRVFLPPSDSLSFTGGEGLQGHPIPRPVERRQGSEGEKETPVTRRLVGTCTPHYLCLTSLKSPRSRDSGTLSHPGRLLLLLSSRYTHRTDFLSWPTPLPVLLTSIPKIVTFLRFLPLLTLEVSTTPVRRVRLPENSTFGPRRISGSSRTSGEGRWPYLPPERCDEGSRPSRYVRTGTLPSLGQVGDGVDGYRQTPT